MTKLLAHYRSYLASVGIDDPRFERGFLLLLDRFEQYRRQHPNRMNVSYLDATYLIGQMINVDTVDRIHSTPEHQYRLLEMFGTDFDDIRAHLSDCCVADSIERGGTWSTESS